MAGAAAAYAPRAASSGEEVWSGEEEANRASSAARLTCVQPYRSIYNLINPHIVVQGHTRAEVQATRLVRGQGDTRADDERPTTRAADERPTRDKRQEAEARGEAPLPPLLRFQ